MATSAQYLTDYEKSQKRYEDLVSGQSKFTDLVKQKLGEKTNYNKDLIEQQNALTQNSMALPSALRAEFSTGPTINPLRQEELIQGRQSALASSMGSVADLLSARGQRDSDILGTAANTYGTMLQGAGTAAENAWRLYQDRLAQEEAARARAAAAAQPGLGDILSALQGGAAGGGEASNSGELVIETKNKPGEANKFNVGQVEAYLGRNVNANNPLDALAVLANDFGGTLQSGWSEFMRSAEQDRQKKLNTINKFLNFFKRK